MNKITEQLLEFSLLHDFQRDVLRIFEYVYAERSEEAEAHTLYLVRELLEWGYTPMRDDLTLECEIARMLVESFNGALVSWLQLTNRPFLKYSYEVGGNALLSCSQDPKAIEKILGYTHDYLLGGDPIDGLPDRRNIIYDMIKEYEKKTILNLTLHGLGAEDKGYEYVRDIHLLAERDDLTSLFQKGYKIGLGTGHPTLKRHLFDDLYILYKPITDSPIEHKH